MKKRKNTTKQEIWRKYWRKEQQGRTKEGMVGRCGGGFETDEDLSCEKKGTGQK